MKVFISWSGGISHKVALALKEWLPNVIQAVDPFVSSENIEKGARWFPEIGAQLESTHFGILCLTPENLATPWLLFEAGALSKALNQARVSPFLIGVSKADVKGPLAQFQMTEPTYEDVKKLVSAINAAQKEESQRLSEPKIATAFDKWWPDLDKQISKLAEEAAAPSGEAPPARAVRDILEEVLDTSRGVSQELQVHGQYLVSLLRLAAAEEMKLKSGFVGGLYGLGGRSYADFISTALSPYQQTGGIINYALRGREKQPPEEKGKEAVESAKKSEANNEGSKKK